MAVTKTNTTFFEETRRKLSNVSQLKLFPIMIDNDRETKFANLFRSYKLNDDIITNVLFFITYEVEDGEYWDDIAFKHYDNPELWWVIAMINEVNNPFEELEVGSNIKILQEQYIYNLIKDIERISDM